MLEQFDDALAVALPRGARPVVLDAFQQVAAAQLERGLRVTVRQPFELDRVDPQPVARRDRPTRSPFDRDGGITEIPRRSVHRAVRRLARALWSSTSGQKRDASSARGDRSTGEREIAEQRPGALRR